ncbi:hypothetical protein BCV69DRAFT_311305 [Microstroma glucosiphilum]|uniref:Uncharacterized protein n=1 Tax=Pseudomicrostroma glucosiphilum TaxID=1684307 RepID=A0A316UH51_9BASI|nr:hypothetical protein BCV69DRAFT_311305 [Pseudomicrostroma glucosiphilum]PWN22505.1 hypothetical protein BCV69DRAFT_311305 [Pseudomicrostroma glucosiphilum]
MQSDHIAQESHNPNAHQPGAQQDQRALSLEAKPSPDRLFCSLEAVAQVASDSAFDGRQPMPQAERSETSLVSAGNVGTLNRQQRRKDMKAVSRQVRQLEAEHRARKAAIKRSEARHKQKCMPFERRDSGMSNSPAVRGMPLPPVGHEDLCVKAASGEGLAESIGIYKHHYKYGELLVPHPRSVDQNYVDHLTSEMFRLSQALVEFRVGTPAYRDMDCQIEIRRVQLDMISQARLRRTHFKELRRGLDAIHRDADIDPAAQLDQDDATFSKTLSMEDHLRGESLMPEEHREFQGAAEKEPESTLPATSGAITAKAQKNKRKNERKKAAARQAKEKQQQQQPSSRSTPEDGGLDSKNAGASGSSIDSGRPKHSHRLQRSTSFHTVKMSTEQEKQTVLRHAKSASFAQASTQQFPFEALCASETVSTGDKEGSSGEERLTDYTKMLNPNDGSSGQISDQPQQPTAPTVATVNVADTPECAEKSTEALHRCAQGLQESVEDAPASSAKQAKTCSPCARKTADVIDDQAVPIIDSKYHALDRADKGRHSSPPGEAQQISRSSSPSPSPFQDERGPHDSPKDHAHYYDEDGLWVRSINGPCVYVRDEDVVFDRSFSVYGKHVVELVLQKYEQAIVDHHIVGEMKGYLVLEGGFIVELLDRKGRCDIIGFFPEGSPYHIPLTPLLAEEARRRAMHEELQLRQWMARESAALQDDSETDHGYSASEGSLSDGGEDDATRSEESLPHRRHRRSGTIQDTLRKLQHDSQFSWVIDSEDCCEESDGQATDEDSDESIDCTDDCLQERKQGHWRPHREQEAAWRTKTYCGAGPLSGGHEARCNLQGAQRPPPAYKLPRKLQELKARLAAGKLAEQVSPESLLGINARNAQAPYDPAERPGRRSIEPSLGARKPPQATSRNNFRIPSSRPAPPKPRLIESKPTLRDDAPQQKNISIAEEAPLRKYGGIDAASLPRPKVARSLRSRHFGVRLGIQRDRRHNAGSQRALTRREHQPKPHSQADNDAAHARQSVDTEAGTVNMQEATLRALQEALRRSLGVLTMNDEDRAPHSSHDATETPEPNSSRVYEIETEEDESVEQAEGGATNGI